MINMLMTTTFSEFQKIMEIQLCRKTILIIEIILGLTKNDVYEMA